MLSVITPTHNPRWLLEALESLNAQTYRGNWEWVIIPNGDCTLPIEITEYPNARIVPCPDDVSRNIGALKRFGSKQARGDIIVELDHDDMLTPPALEMVMDAFRDPTIDFVYSNFAEFHDETWKPHVYDLRYGWETERQSFYGRDFTVMIAFEPTAQSLSLVHYAPNHVRAWRANAYWEIGGHDPEMAVADDHDLCCRFYLSKQMRHINECLYLYRIHGDNSYLQRNAAVQNATKRVRDKYILQLAERWVDLESLPKVDLGAAHNKPEGYIGVDLYPSEGVDIVHDITKGLPFDDSSVGLIRAFDFLEHIPDSVALMNEIYRVLVDGGWLLSLTPSTDGRGAFQDPTHCSFFNENSFWYYTNRFYAGYVPKIMCRFQAMRVKTDFPSGFHRERKIPYVYAGLVATKSWRRRPGLMEI